MDFDNIKVYGDTSITDGLVSSESLCSANKISSKKVFFVQNTILAPIGLFWAQFDPFLTVFDAKTPFQPLRMTFFLPFLLPELNPPNPEARIPQYLLPCRTKDGAT